MWLAAQNNQYECCVLLIANGANPFIEDKEDKKPCDVATDKVRQYLIKAMEARLEMNASNYFKEKVLKKHKEDAIKLFSKKGHDRMRRIENDFISKK